MNFTDSSFNFISFEILILVVESGGLRLFIHNLRIELT